jgi:hypothetical protein
VRISAEREAATSTPLMSARVAPFNDVISKPYSSLEKRVRATVPTDAGDPGGRGDVGASLRTKNAPRGR